MKRIPAAAGLALASPAGPLEHELDLPAAGGAPRAAAVCCHPHPLMGGTMRNPVLVRCGRALAAAGIPALRLNFRGVGRSPGTHGGGGPEAEDVAAALDALAAAFPGAPLWIVGYSFGAGVGGAVASREPRVRALVTIGFPLGRGYAVPTLGDRPLLAIQGTRDALGSPEALATAFAGASTRLRVVPVPDADHLFVGRTGDAAAALASNLRHLRGEAPQP